MVVQASMTEAAKRRIQTGSANDRVHMNRIASVLIFGKRWICLWPTRWPHRRSLMSRFPLLLLIPWEPILSPNIQFFRYEFPASALGEAAHHRRGLGTKTKKSEKIDG